MGKYSQVFELEFDAPADDVWSALRSGLQDLDGGKLENVDDGDQACEFSTGVSLTSWGEYMRAEVEGGARAASVSVSGIPKGTFLTTKWGEEIHAKVVEKRLRDAIEKHLATA